MSDRLTIADCRRAGYCVSGTKRKCAEIGVDFRKLVSEGVPLAVFDGIEDENVQRCVKFAREREDGR